MAEGMPKVWHEASEASDVSIHRTGVAEMCVIGFGQNFEVKP